MKMVHIRYTFYKSIVILLIVLLLFYSCFLSVGAYSTVTDQTGSSSSSYGGKYDLSAKHDVNLYANNQEECKKILQTCYQEFRSWGMTPEGAAAICGNLYCESNGDPTITQGLCDWSSFSYGITGLGLMQFTYWSIQVDLFNIAHEHGRSWTDLGVQLEMISNYVGPHLKDSCKEFYEEGYALRTLSDLFCTEYERPAINNVDARYSASEGYFNSFKDLPAKKYDGSLSSDTSSTPEDTASLFSDSITAQWDLIGMPRRNGLTSELNIPDMATRDGLTIAEKDNLVGIGEDLYATKQFNVWARARVSVVFVGLLLLIYAIMLSMAVIFDNSNTFINISLVSVLTLGAIKYVNDKSFIEENEGVKYTSTKRMIVLLVVMYIIAGILISGGVIPAIIQTMYRVMGFMNIS